MAQSGNLPDLFGRHPKFLKLFCNVKLFMFLPFSLNYERFKNVNLISAE